MYSEHLHKNIKNNNNNNNNVHVLMDINVLNYCNDTSISGIRIKSMKINNYSKLKCNILQLNL